jgi:hypothetical protein
MLVTGQNPFPEAYMKNILQTMGKIFAGLFAFLFVLTALLSIPMVTVGSRLLNPNLYKHALLDQQAYEQLPEIIGEMIVASASYDPCAEDPIRCEEMAPALAACYIQELGSERFAQLTSGEEQPLATEQQLIQACFEQFGHAAAEPAETGGMPVYLETLTAGDWATVIQRLLPPGELQGMVEPLLDDTFAYLQGDTGRVSLSLVTFKERLAGATGDEVLRALITSQPDCTDVLLSLITGELLLDDLTLCNPPALLLPLAISTTRLALDEAINTIPDEILILPPRTQAAAGEGASSGDLVRAFRLARLVLFLSPLLPLLCLGLLTLFGVRSLKGWLRWWGIPFSMAGGIVLVGSLALLLFWQPAWDKWVLPRFPVYLGEGFSDLVRGLAGTVTRDLTLWMGLAGLLLLLAGVAAWVGVKFIKR